ncbi:uncharacterized protein O3C94_016535 [Discoglossus pictus]
MAQVETNQDCGASVNSPLSREVRSHGPERPKCRHQRAASPCPGTVSVDIREFPQPAPDTVNVDTTGLPRPAPDSATLSTTLRQENNLSTRPAPAPMAAGEQDGLMGLRNQRDVPSENNIGNPTDTKCSKCKTFFTKHKGKLALVFTIICVFTAVGTIFGTHKRINTTAKSLQTTARSQQTPMAHQSAAPIVANTYLQTTPDALQVTCNGQNIILPETEMYWRPSREYCEQRGDRLPNKTEIQALKECIVKGTDYWIEQDHKLAGDPKICDTYNTKDGFIALNCNSKRPFVCVQSLISP